MVMVIGSTHSTLKDTLPTLIKIEKTVKKLKSQSKIYFKYGSYSFQTVKVNFGT